ncbi:MAG: TMEM175 family protein, partial [Rhodanobacteraceae bacterium]
MPSQVLYYRAMVESSVPARRETREERTESARLDNFVDGAFAFAITLLIISGGSLPKNVLALEHALRGVPAFAACFAELAWFWHGHVRWRDTVQLTDKTSLLLSLLLVFFALIFVFPLHLVFAGLFNGFSGGILSPDYNHTFENVANATRALFVFYGLSFACMAGTLSILYRHGVRAGMPTSREDAVTLRVQVVLWSWFAAVGVVSMLIALSLPSRIGWIQGLPGFTYFLLAFTGPLAHLYSKRVKLGLPT